MPLEWKPGRNPYVYNYFGKLRVGPNVTPPQIVAQAKNLVVRVDAGRPLELAGEKLDQHSIQEASSKLREPRSLAEELLLVHPQIRQEKKKMKSIVDDIRKTAAVPEQESPFPLINPLALFWFVPAPGPEAAKLPEWQEFNLGESGRPPGSGIGYCFR